MDKYFGYLRVSTTKQGDGVSLDEQKDAIAKYAALNNFEIVQWYEEMVTAAKKGRKEFNQMIKHLRAGKADGVIIHKIDRSARNLDDWVKFSSLIEDGFDIRFVSGDLSLRDRGSRLSADLQAVIAADYIRNLQEEVRKGFYGRLKQGLYPLSAPVGYFDNGCGGKVKTIDPEKSKLIKAAFELYTTGEYSLARLTDEMYQRGLVNNVGKRIDVNGWYRILKNPFYAGIIQIWSTGETFEGIHKPIISAKLFEKVQNVKQGKTVRGQSKHKYLFSRMFKCENCSYSLVAEKQNDTVYYRCHTKNCLTKTIQEVVLHQTIDHQLSKFQFESEELPQLSQVVEQYLREQKEDKTELKKSLHRRLVAVRQKLKKLGDALLDNAFSKDEYFERKKPILTEEADIKYQLSLYDQKDSVFEAKVKQNLEMLKSLCLSYSQASFEEKRIMLKNATSKLSVKGQNALVELKTPFRELAEIGGIPSSWGDDVTPRKKLDQKKKREMIAKILVECSKKEIESDNDM